MATLQEARAQIAQRRKSLQQARANIPQVTATSLRTQGGLQGREKTRQLHSAQERVSQELQKLKSFEGGLDKAETAHKKAVEEQKRLIAKQQRRNDILNRYVSGKPLNRDEQFQLQKTFDQTQGLEDSIREIKGRQDKGQAIQQVLGKDVVTNPVFLAKYPEQFELDQSQIDTLTKLGAIKPAKNVSIQGDVIAPITTTPPPSSSLIKSGDIGNVSISGRVSDRAGDSGNIFIRTKQFISDLGSGIFDGASNKTTEAYFDPNTKGFVSASESSGQATRVSVNVPLEVLEEAQKTTTGTTIKNVGKVVTSLSFPLLALEKPIATNLFDKGVQGREKLMRTVLTDTPSEIIKRNKEFEGLLTDINNLGGNELEGRLTQIRRAGGRVTTTPEGDITITDPTFGFGFGKNKIRIPISQVESRAGTGVATLSLLRTTSILGGRDLGARGGEGFAMFVPEKGIKVSGEKEVELPQFGTTGYTNEDGEFIRTINPEVVILPESRITKEGVIGFGEGLGGFAADVSVTNFELPAKLVYSTAFFVREGQKDISGFNLKERVTSVPSQIGKTYGTFPIETGIAGVIGAFQIGSGLTKYAFGTQFKSGKIAVGSKSASGKIILGEQVGVTEGGNIIRRFKGEAVTYTGIEGERIVGTSRVRKLLGLDPSSGFKEGETVLKYGYGDVVGETKIGGGFFDTKVQPRYIPTSTVISKETADAGREKAYQTLIGRGNTPEQANKLLDGTDAQLIRSKTVFEGTTIQGGKNAGDTVGEVFNFGEDGVTLKNLQQSKNLGFVEGVRADVTIPTSRPVQIGEKTIVFAKLPKAETTIFEVGAITKEGEEFILSDKGGLAKNVKSFFGTSVENNLLSTTDDSARLAVDNIFVGTETKVVVPTGTIYDQKAITFSKELTPDIFKPTTKTLSDTTLFDPTIKRVIDFDTMNLPISKQTPPTGGKKTPPDTTLPTDTVKNIMNPPTDTINTLVSQISTPTSLENIPRMVGGGGQGKSIYEQFTFSAGAFAGTTNVGGGLGSLGNLDLGSSNKQIEEVSPILVGRIKTIETSETQPEVLSKTFVDFYPRPKLKSLSKTTLKFGQGQGQGSSSDFDTDSDFDTGSDSGSGKKPPRDSPPRSPLIIPNRDIPESEEAIRKKVKSKETKRKQGYHPEVKDKGKWMRVAKKPRTKKEALAIAGHIVDNSTAVQLRLIKSKQKAIKETLKRRINRAKYRDYSVRAGKRTALPNQGLIELKRHRIDTRGEKLQLSAGKVMRGKSLKSLRTAPRARKKVKKQNFLYGGGFGGKSQRLV